MIKPGDYVNIISSCVLFTFGVFGNAFIIVYFTSRTKHLRSMSCYHLFIIQLALTDISVCIFLPAVKIYDSFNGDFWNIAEVACLWFSHIPYHVATAVSAWLLVALSFDRYRRIVHPFKWQLNKKMVFLFVTLLWGVSYFAALPFTLNLLYDQDRKICEETRIYILSEIYHLCIQSIAIECLLPILSMSVLYFKTSRKLLSQSVDAQQLSCENYEHLKQRKKAVKTIKWLIVLFTLTVLPGRIIHVVRSILRFEETINQEYVSPVLQLMDKCTYVNNMINLFVYCKINKDFRQYLRKKFIC